MPRSYQFSSSYNECQFLTLQEYQELASITLRKYCPHLSKNEDALALVTQTIIRADSTYQSDKGASRETFRMESGKYACYTANKLNMKEHSYERLIPRIEEELSIKEFEQQTLKEEVEEKLYRWPISPLAKKCLRMKYLQNVRIKDIAEELSMTPGYISKVIKDAISKVRQNVVLEK